MEGFPYHDAKEVTEETTDKVDYIKSKSSAWQKQNKKKKKRVNEGKYSQKTVRSKIIFKNIYGYSYSTVCNSKKLGTT